MKIIGYKQGSDRSGTFRISFTYLHGKAEEDNGYDVFGIEGDLFDPGEGIHDCTINNEPGKLYLWKEKGRVIEMAEDGKSFRGYHGLACYESDTKARMYCVKQYEAKSEHI